MSNPHARMSLGDVLKENAMKRPANSNGPIEWEFVAGGIRPYRREAADCAANGPEFNSTCHNKPVWVIEHFDGHTPTCLTHSGQVLNSLLSALSKDSDFEATPLSEVALYLHPYKGA